MAYELNIREPEGQSEGDAFLEGVCRELAQAGPVFATDPDRLVWRASGTEIGLRVHRGEGGWSLDAAVPWGALPEEVDQALERLLALAADRSLRVFDPQLGRAVGRADQSPVFAAFVEANGYHVEYGGRVEDPRQGLATAAAVDHDGTSLQVKVLLGLFGLAIAAFVLFRSCVLGPTMKELEALEASRPEGPPPGWLERHTPEPPLRLEAVEPAAGDPAAP